MSKYRQNDEHEHSEQEPKDFRSRVLAGLLAGLLIGAMAGAVAMLLLAPRSGKKTRARLQRQGQEFGDQTAASVEDVLEQARDLTQQFTNDARKQAKKLEKRGSAVLDG